MATWKLYIQHNLHDKQFGIKAINIFQGTIGLFLMCILSLCHCPKFLKHNYLNEKKKKKKKSVYLLESTCYRTLPLFFFIVLDQGCTNITFSVNIFVMLSNSMTKEKYSNTFYSKYSENRNTQEKTETRLQHICE